MTDSTKKEAITIAGSLIGLLIANRNDRHETVGVILGGFLGAIVANEIMGMAPKKLKK